ncbi:MAG: hypothetical protein ACK520_09625 [Inhella sp.]
MHPTVPEVQSTHGSRRNRVVLLAVLPFMLIAMGASVFWVVLIGRIALGAVALFFPVAIVVIPAALGMAGLLLGGAGAGLAALGAMLWSGSSLRRWGLAAPALLLGLSFVAGTPFLHDSLAAQLADGFGVQWSAWALVAQLVFPAVVAVMALCVLWPGGSPSRLATGVAWLGVGLAWAALFYERIGVRSCLLLPVPLRRLNVDKRQDPSGTVGWALRGIAVLGGVGAEMPESGSRGASSGLRAPKRGYAKCPLGYVPPAEFEAQ